MVHFRASQVPSGAAPECDLQASTQDRVVWTRLPLAHRQDFMLPAPAIGGKQSPSTQNRTTMRHQRDMGLVSSKLLNNWMLQ